MAGKKILSFALFSMLFFYTIGSSQSQPPPGPGNTTTIVANPKVLVRLYMSPQSINVEGDYPGTGHSGGGMMACYARYQTKDQNGNITTEDVNVSDKAVWAIDDTSVYWIEFGVTLFPDGLWVNPYFIDVVDGFTYVFAYFEGLRADGQIWVEDYR